MSARMAHAATEHLESGSVALRRAAEAALVSQGVQWTELRAQIFDALAVQSSPSSAYDVAERVSAAVGRRIAANSVYRILDLFVAHNLAKRIESRNAYVANVHPSCSHDCVFLVCHACGRVDHLDDDILADSMRKRAEALGFAPSRSVLELLGHCRHCSA